VRGIATDIPKKRKKKDKMKSEPKLVDESIIELMQVDRLPAEPIGARFPADDHSVMLNWCYPMFQPPGNPNARRSARSAKTLQRIIHPKRRNEERRRNVARKR